MIEQIGDLWQKHAEGHYIVIPTNGVVIERRLVMGAGLAKQAKERFPRLPEELGYRVSRIGNLVMRFEREHLYSFPTKNHWKDRSDLQLIGNSAWQLQLSMNRWQLPVIYLPRVGCGLGQLCWETEVKPVLKPYFDDRFIILQPPR